MAASKEISSSIKQFESRERTGANQNKRIEELFQSLLKTNFSWDKFDSNEIHRDEAAIVIDQADTMSEVVSFCLLCGGLILLFKSAYAEYVAYVNMMNDGKGQGYDDKSRISVSMRDFFHYR